jgi:hypothetical protein
MGLVKRAKEGVDRIKKVSRAQIEQRSQGGRGRPFLIMDWHLNTLGYRSGYHGYAFRTAL